MTETARAAGRVADQATALAAAALGDRRRAGRRAAGRRGRDAPARPAGRRDGRGPAAPWGVRRAGYRSAVGALADLTGWDRFEARRRVIAADEVCPGVGLDGAVRPPRLPATATA